jgi:hypothetical protein
VEFLHASPPLVQLLCQTPESHGWNDHDDRSQFRYQRVLAEAVGTVPIARPELAKNLIEGLGFRHFNAILDEYAVSEDGREALWRHVP